MDCTKYQNAIKGNSKQRGQDKTYRQHRLLVHSGGAALEDAQERLHDLCSTEAELNQWFAALIVRSILLMLGS